jgi:hypothetical protein
MNANTDITTPLVKAFSYAWAAIQANHPEVPNVVITLGAGSGKVLGGLVLGHFAPHRWARGEENIHELFVGGEGLSRPAQEVMATLLHEAAHGIAIERDIQDVSRGGRYHNSTFKSLAAELGVETTYSKSLGWSDSTITPAAVKTYAAAIRRLNNAMVAYRRDPFARVTGKPGLPGSLPGGITTGRPINPGKGRGRAGNNNGLSLRCECETPRRIRVSPSVLELGPITCGLCKADFREV